MGGLRPRYLTLAAADLAGAVTIVALLRPEVQFGTRAICCSSPPSPFSR